jgi:hypothetical protein
MVAQKASLPLERFLTFVTEAQRLSAATNNSQSISDFRQFVLESERLLSSPNKSTAVAKFFEFVQKAEQVTIPRPAFRPAPVADFKHFVLHALPNFVENIKRMLPLMAERAALAERWLVNHDLLHVANFGFVEDSWTELMAWAIDPATHPATADKRQKAWLKAMELDENICNPMACTPKSQFVTDDGIPDLILQFENTTLVVEAKTGSAEHVTPSSKKWQTFAYRESVHRKLNLPPEHKIEVVFITPNRRQAKDPQAKVTTFNEFVFAICGALDNQELPADTRAAYAMLFTHFLTQSVPSNASVRELVADIAFWSRQPDWLDQDQIVLHKDELLAAAQFLIPEKTR